MHFSKLLISLKTKVLFDICREHLDVTPGVVVWCPTIITQKQVKEHVATAAAHICVPLLSKPTYYTSPQVEASSPIITIYRTVNITGRNANYKRVINPQQWQLGNLCQLTHVTESYLEIHR